MLQSAEYVFIGSKMNVQSEHLQEHSFNGAVSPTTDASNTTESGSVESEQKQNPSPPTSASEQMQLTPTEQTQSNMQHHQQQIAHQQGLMEQQSSNEQQLASNQPATSSHNQAETESEQSSAPKAKIIAASLDPDGETRSMETFITDLATAHPTLDLSCLTTDDIKIMMRHKINLDANVERFGLVPLEEYNATRRPKPVPKAPEYNNAYQSSSNNTMSRSSAYGNMQNYTAASAQSQMQSNQSAVANQYSGMSQAMAANWYNAMMSGAYPPEQIQAYFSEMLMKMSAQGGQNAGAMAGSQQQWSTPAATSYAVSSAAQLQAAAPVYSSSTSEQPYNLKAGSAYDARMSGSSSLDSAANHQQQAAASSYESKPDVQAQLYAQYAQSIAQAQAAVQQQQQQQQNAYDMSAWQQAAAGAGSNSELALQYAASQAAADEQPPNAHQGYM